MTTTDAPSENPTLRLLLPRANRFLTGQRQHLRPALADWLTDSFKEQLQ